MAANAWAALLAANFNKSDLTSTLILRAPYALGPAEDTQTIDLQTALAVIQHGVVFRHDATDLSSAHDGTSVLVDLNGRRYKADQQPIPLAALDRTGTPPGSPAPGDAYLVIAAASGDWIGHEDDIAVWSARGWLFIAPRVGALIHVEDEGGYWHYTAGGDWEAGFGTLLLPPATVDPLKLLFPMGVSVETETDTPPGGPTEGQAWIVGTSPSGAWTGHNAELAIWLSGAWVFVAPYEGAQAYDKAADELLTYTTAWTRPSEVFPIELVAIHDLSTGTVFDTTGLGGFLHLRVNIIADTGIFTQTWSMRTSANDGSSYNASAGDYLFDGSITATSLISQTTADPGRRAWTCSIDGWNDATAKTVASVGGTVTGVRRVAEKNNALRILLSSAISGGQAQIWGIRG